MLLTNLCVPEGQKQKYYVKGLCSGAEHLIIGSLTMDGVLGSRWACVLGNRGLLFTGHLM